MRKTSLRPAARISDIDPERTYTDLELQELLSVGRFALYKYRRETVNPLPFYQIGGQPQYRGKDVLRWIERQRREGSGRRPR